MKALPQSNLLLTARGIKTPTCHDQVSLTSRLEKHALPGVLQFLNQLLKIEMKETRGGGCHTGCNNQAINFMVRSATRCNGAGYGVYGVFSEELLYSYSYTSL